MKIETQIEIYSSPESIWQVLLDFEQYPIWNPFIQSIKGKAAEGEQINITLPSMKFSPILTILNPYQRLSWKGKLGIKGLFDGHHQFEIREITKDHCLFIHREYFSGLLLPFLKKKLNTETREGFIAMNTALKNRVEKR